MAIDASSSLNALYLVDSPTGLQMAEVFHLLAHNAHLQTFCLTRPGNSLDEHEKEISVSLQRYLQDNKHSQHLSLTPCSASVLEHLKDGLLQNQSLQSLDLSDNVLKEVKQTQSINLILREITTLVSLDLSNCTFVVGGINHIVSGLQSNATLQCLIINCLKIAPTLQSDEATSISTSNSEIWEMLFDSIMQHKSIHTLCVCENKLDFTLVEDLVQQNLVIRTLKVDHCGFSEAQTEQLANRLSTRHSSCSLRDNQQQADTSLTNIHGNQKTENETVA